MSRSPKMHRVGIVGAGFIADIHLEVLHRMSEVQTVGVCDLNQSRAEALARKWGVSVAVDRVEKLLEQSSPDIVHVIVPPALHFDVASSILKRGVGVFLEKPMGLSVEECESLNRMAQDANVPLGVNHNNAFLPVLQRAQRWIKEGKIGKVQHVAVELNVPLRQLDAGDFSHWMFREPRNIIFEQAVHPISQITTLLGPVVDVVVNARGKRELIEGCLNFYDTWMLSLQCERGTAQLFFSPGKEYPENWMHIVGQDGSIRLDFLHSLATLQEKSRWLEFYDTFLVGWRNASRLRRASWKNLTDYPLSLLHLKGRSDPFFLGMKGSLEGFHRAALAGTPLPCSGKDGLAVIDCCERATQNLEVPKNPLAPPPEPDYSWEDDQVLVIGAAGFIGRHLVKALTDAGENVRAMVRKPDYVPAELRHPRVRVVHGDITSQKDVVRAIEGVRAVYQLATGDLSSPANAERTFVGGLRNVLEASEAAGVEKLVFTSTIAVLNLGEGETVNDDTPVDSQPSKRPLYPQVKIQCENLLREYAQQNEASQKGPEITIFRPAIVVGRGGIAQHSAVGLWNRDGQAIGWGRGLNPLPFVLVKDVAEALVAKLGQARAGLRLYNLTGDVGLTATEYMQELSRATGRRLHFYGRPLWLSQGMEIGKWVVKKLSGRKDAPFPSYRDLKSRTNRSPFDCSGAKQDLGWTPVSDRDEFIRQAIDVFAPPEVSTEKTPQGSPREYAEQRP